MSPDNIRIARQAGGCAWLLIGLVALFVGAGLAGLAHWLGGTPIRSILALWGIVLVGALLLRQLGPRWRRWALIAALAIGLALVYAAGVR